MVTIILDSFRRQFDVLGGSFHPNQLSIPEVILVPPFSLVTISNMAASMLYVSLHALRKTSVLTLTKSRFSSGSERKTTITIEEVINNGANESSMGKITGSTSMEFEGPLAGEKALYGFARAMEILRKEPVSINDERRDEINIQDKTFASILRWSKLMQIGDPFTRVVAGTIMETVGNDLYIDVGCKFYCVCEKPKLNPG